MTDASPSQQQNSPSSPVQDHHPAGPIMPEGASKMKQYTDNLLKVFVNHLGQMAAQNNQMVTTAQLSQAYNIFTSNQNKQITDYYINAWENIEKLATPGTPFVEQREHFLERLLVEDITPIIVKSADELPRDGQTLPRDAIPGICSAFASLLGTQMYENYSRSILEIVENLKAKIGVIHYWQEAKNDQNLMILRQDLLILMVPYFHDMDKRYRWFLGQLEANRPANTENNLLSGWEFSKRDFYLLAAALFRKIIFDARNPSRTVLLQRRYGPERVDAIKILAKEIQSFQSHIGYKINLIAEQKA